MKYKTKKTFDQYKLEPVGVSVDYACMQFFGIVRHYIQDKYDISLQDLEYILFVFPLGLFSLKDHRSFPHKSYASKSIRKRVKDGYLVTFFEDQRVSSRNQLYRLSNHYEKICVEFYKYMHQEKLIPEVAKFNNLFDQSQSSIYKRKQAFGIVRLNKRTKGMDPFDKNWTSAEKKLQSHIKEDKKNKLSDKDILLKNLKRKEEVKRQARIKEIMEEQAKKRGY